MTPSLPPFTFLPLSLHSFPPLRISLVCLHAKELTCNPQNNKDINDKNTNNANPLDKETERLSVLGATLVLEASLEPCFPRPAAALKNRTTIVSQIAHLDRHAANIGSAKVNSISVSVSHDTIYIGMG